MPEGPSIVILREQAAGFAGHLVERVAGNSRLDLRRMLGERVLALRSWGKHFLICFDVLTLRVHFMLFGSYRINERRGSAAEPGMRSRRAQFLRLLAEIHRGRSETPSTTGAPMSWRPSGILSRRDASCGRNPTHWRATSCWTRTCSPAAAAAAAAATSSRTKYCIGSGFIPKADWARCRAGNAANWFSRRDYSFDFYAWKKAYVLRKHHQVHTRTHCPRDGTRLTHRAKLGRRQRRAFFCERCQQLYC
jgi:endonuclease VIII